MLARSFLRPRLGRGMSTFADVEKRMWDAGAASYAATFAKITSQAHDAVLDAASVPRSGNKLRKFVYSVAPASFPDYNYAAQPNPPQEVPEEVLASLSDEAPFRVLDVASGTGGLAAAAAQRAVSEVVGVDFSESMVSAAQPVADEHRGIVSFALGNAEKLSAADASFDAVVIGFGLLHLPQPELAIAEAFRVLKPGGKLAFSVWESPEHTATGFSLMLDAIAAHGNPDVDLGGGAAPLPFFHFADQKNAAAALAAAGFDADSVTFERVPCTVALESEADLYSMFASATARTRATLEGQSEAQRQAISSAVAEQIASRFCGVYTDGASRAVSWKAPTVGTDAPLMNGEPTGRTPYMVRATPRAEPGPTGWSRPLHDNPTHAPRWPSQVPMPAVIAAATKPKPVAKPAAKPAEKAAAAPKAAAEPAQQAAPKKKAAKKK